MARSVNTIQQLMIADIQSDPTLSGLSSTSKRAIWILLTFIFATAIFLLEILIDVFKSEVEATAAAAAPASAGWLQNQLLMFQYDPIIPQIVQLINFAPSYPVVDTTKQIISRVAVITTVSGQTLIKLAMGNPPQALTSPQLSAAQDYVDTIGATVNYTCTSTDPDELIIAADIYYAGQYSAIIQTSVIDAINNFLATFDSANFNGSFKVSDLELTIRAVPGVNDVILNNVIARRSIDAISAGTYLVQNAQVISRIWATIAGYIISETTSGSTLLDTLNFIPQ